MACMLIADDDIVVRSLRTMSSAECRFRPAICFIVPSSPKSGHRTLKPL